jgi:thiol:disulfide interchange protein
MSNYNEYSSQEPYYNEVPQYQPAPPSSSKAIISMISSIAGLVLGLSFLCAFMPCSLPLFGIGGIVGLILGRQAQAEIAASGGTLGGEGMAQAGIIMGWINVGFAALALLLIVLAVVGVVGLGILSEMNY